MSKNTYLPLHCIKCPEFKFVNKLIWESIGILKITNVYHSSSLSQIPEYLQLMEGDIFILCDRSQKPRDGALNINAPFGWNWEGIKAEMK